MKTTTRIKVESRRTVVITGGRGATLQWCPGCNHDAQMLTPEDASALAHVRIRSVYRWVEAGMVHFSETRDGFLLICINSLPGAPGPPRQLETIVKSGSRRRP